MAMIIPITRKMDSEKLYSESDFEAMTTDTLVKKVLTDDHIVSLTPYADQKAFAQETGVSYDIMSEPELVQYIKDRGVMIYFKQ